MSTEVIIAKKPYGRGVDLQMGLFRISLHLPTPCSTSDYHVFITLIKELVKLTKCKNITCCNQPCNIKKIELLTKEDMAEAIKHYSLINPLETYIYFMTPFVRIVVGEKEQASFSNSQDKFDAFLSEKQSSQGINNQVEPLTFISKNGISSTVFLDAGRYLIVPKTITRTGTNQIVTNVKAVNGEYEMGYSEFLEKVPQTVKEFDDERLVVKFSKKDFLLFAKKVNCTTTEQRVNQASKEKKKSGIELKQKGLTAEDIKLLDTYFESMSNLYGVISLQDAFNIIQKQTHYHFAEKQFLAFARLKNNEFPDYTIGTLSHFKTIIDLDNDIVNNRLLKRNTSPYKYIKQGQEDKPIYIPSQSELFKYKNEKYLDDTTILKPLTNFLSKHAMIFNGYIPAKEFVREFALNMKGDIDISSEVESLLRSVTHIQGYNEETFLQKLVGLVQDLHNQSRLWANNGYTPEELREMGGGINLGNIRIF